MLDVDDLGGGAAGDRRVGARGVLRDAGLRDDLVAYVTFTQDSGKRATAELLAREPDLDAIFASSDVMALGALRACVRPGGGSRPTCPSSVSTTSNPHATPTRHSPRCASRGRTRPG